MKVDSRLSKSEQEIKSISASQHTFNKEISSVRTCSNDALMSIQDLTKSVEGTNQHYNEMSNKINELEILINLKSTQYTEQFENMRSLNNDRVDDSIGVVCQLVAKRLNQIENLKEALNKISTTKTPLSLKMDGIKNQCEDLSNKIVQIESKCFLPNVGFYAWRVFDFEVGSYNVENFTNSDGNYGYHFDSISGMFTAPFNGLYLISISSKLDDDNRIDITKKSSCQAVSLPGKCLCCFRGSQTITFCAELKVGERVSIHVTIRKKDMGKCIEFSCCMINGYTKI
ncbi:unnamed protein product [Lymnaea stagnalis]|uniref:C1q domain-containing protein n=1 Tax=Lymnaea stagnalis TaxID=6523 RepID=A0AAV2IE17_LYMST